MLFFATTALGGGHHTGFVSFSATLAPIDAGVSNAVGEVTVVVKDESLFLTGKAEKLEQNLTEGVGGCNPSGTNNSCGVHIHSGTGCQPSDQGGHFFKALPDPWKLVGYLSTKRRRNKI